MPRDGKSPAKPKSTLAAIEKLRRDRENRRQSAEKFRQQRAAESERNEREGRPGDVDFQRMIDAYRREHGRSALVHSKPGASDISICVRKRPVSSKEIARRDYDCVTCLNPRCIVHSCKLKVDGITKYLDSQTFRFDHTFHEAESTATVYEHTVRSLVTYAFERGRGTCFAYGQTGSGKTYTMGGIQAMAARDMFVTLEKEEFARRGFTISVSFFEIYGGRCSDLLHGRNKVTVREDGGGRIVCQGLKEVTASSKDGILALVERGNRSRTTHATEANETSSRSHAIMELTIRDPSGRLYGKLALIDLAGSERAADTRHHNRQRRVESAEINKSLLALKECIRALDNKSSHVPFRASKLTLVLKDSFTSKRARVVMIATVSPAMSATDHTQNTLRYADRVKEKKDSGPGESAAAGAGGGRGSAPPIAPSILAAEGGGRTDMDRHSPLTLSGGRADPASSPPLSPSAAKLRNVAQAAREGRITEKEKVAAKDSILRGDIPPAPDVPMGRRRPLARHGSAASLGGGSDDSGSGRGGSSRSSRGGASGSGGSAHRRSDSGSRRPYSSGPRSSPSSRHSGVDGARDRPERRGGRASRPTRAFDEAEVHISDVDSDESGGSTERRTEFKSPVAVIRPAVDLHRFNERADAAHKKQSRGNEMVRVGSNASILGRGVASLRGSPPRDPKRARDRELRSPDDSSPAKDLHILHESLRRDALEHDEVEADDSGDMLALHEAVGMIVEEEEDLLNEHMAVVQENAELLTEEGRLLSQVQGSDVVDYDIDAYVTRLDEILRRKLEITSKLLGNLTTFREHLALEEQVSRRLVGPPSARK